MWARRALRSAHTSWRALHADRREGQTGQDDLPGGAGVIEDLPGLGDELRFQGRLEPLEDLLLEAVVTAGVEADHDRDRAGSGGVDGRRDRRRRLPQIKRRHHRHQGEQAARSFRDRVRRASYPRVYRPTPAQRAFEAVDGLDGLDPEAWLNIVDLETAYRSELDNLNEQIRRVIDKHQPREPRRSIERLVSMTDRAEMFFDADDDPIREAFGKRAKLEESYVKRLHDLLTPEQVAKLPTLPSRERRHPMVIRRLN